MSRLVNRRIRLLLAVLTFAFAGLFLRAAWLQGVRAQSLSRLGQTQHREQVVLPAARGTIFDSTGVRLALGEQAMTVYADPMQIRDPRRVAVAAGRALRLDPDRLYRKLADRTRGFVYVARQADAAQAAVLARRHIPGLGFLPEERRAYPQGIVGAQVKESSHGWGSHMIEFFAIGTAIVPIEGAPGIEPPTPVLDLS